MQIIGKSSARRPNGYAVVTSPDGVKEADTRQCCHCGSHFIVVHGSGKLRPYCTLCTAWTCGDPKCHEHFPIEERMDLYEKGLLPSLDAPREMAGRSKLIKLR